MRFSPRMKGCRSSAGQSPSGPGSTPDVSKRKLRLLDIADAAFAQPGCGVAIISAKAPVLVHHQARLVLDLGGECGRLLQIGRERLLAQHRQMLFCGEPHQRRVHLAGRGDIDGVEFASPPASLRRWRKSWKSRTRRRGARHCPRRDRRSPRPAPDLLYRPRRSDGGGSPCRRRSGQCATACSWALVSDHHRKSARMRIIVNNTGSLATEWR